MISHLDELAWHVPTRKAWDKLAFPPPPAEPCTPCQSRHLGYIMGHTEDLGSTLPPLRFCISSLKGEFICIAWNLLFKGSMLAYDPTTNRAKWVPMWGTVSDLSLVEEASTWQLSNIVIQDPPEDAPRMDCFMEHREKHGAEAPADTFCVETALCEEESMEQAPQSDLGEKGNKSSKESDSSENTLCHYSSRCCCPNHISWVNEDQEEGEEQKETEGKKQLTPPASLQGEPEEESMEELPALEQESPDVVPA